MRKKVVNILFCCMAIMILIGLYSVSVLACPDNGSCTETEYDYFYADEEHHLRACANKKCRAPYGNLPHEFQLQSDSTGHWEECEDCGYTKDEETHTFIWDSNALMHWQECEDCGYSTNITEVHNYIWRTTSTTHCQVCTECGYITPETVHTLDKWGTCTVCGDELSEGLMSIIPVAK